MSFKFTFARVGAMTTFLTYLTCLLGTSYIHAAPTHTCPQKINMNKVGFCNSNGTFHEWECYSCPPGLGHSIECEKIYNKPFKVECLPCKKGIQYSDKYDHSQCKPCTRCTENEIQSGQCETDKDTTRCTCKAGYYRDTLTSACMPCSWCCNDNKTNQQHVPECKNLAKKCSFQTAKSCEPTTLPPSTLPTTTPTPPTSPTTTTPTPPPTSPTTTTPTTKQDWTEESVNKLNSGTMNSNDAESTSHEVSQKTEKEPTGGRKSGVVKLEHITLVIIVLIAVIVIVASLVMIYLCCCRKRSRNSRDSDSIQDSRSRSSTSTSKELNSSAPLLTIEGFEAGLNLNLKSGTSKYCNKHETGPNGVEPPQANGMRLPTRRLDERQLSFISERLGRKIVDLKHDIMQTLCDMLNVQVNRKDYRNLDSFCNLDFYVRQRLSKKDNPMEDIIEIMVSDSKTLKSLLNELYDISRGDVVEKLYEIANTQYT